MSSPPLPLFWRALARLGLMALALAWPLAGHAHDRRDHDRARAAAESGEVLPLRTVLERVATHHPGQVMEVELERDDGVWVYEIKLLQAGGVLRKLKVDARSGEPMPKRMTPR